MSKVYVFATRWVDEFLENKEVLSETKTVNNGQDVVQVEVKSTSSLDAKLKFVCFNCENFDNPKRSSQDVDQLIEELKRNLCREDDEVTFILHDQVLGQSKRHFRFKEGVYGFRHDLMEKDLISKFLRHGNIFSVKKGESILEAILDIIPILNKVEDIKRITQASSDDIVNTDIVEDIQIIFQQKGIPLNIQMTYQNLDLQIKEYVNNLFVQKNGSY